MGIAKEVHAKFCLVASGIQNSQVYYQGVKSVVDSVFWILCWF